MAVAMIVNQGRTLFEQETGNVPYVDLRSGNQDIEVGDDLKLKVIRDLMVLLLSDGSFARSSLGNRWT